MADALSPVCVARLVAAARALGREGVEFLQLREKDMPAGSLAALACALLRALDGTPTRLLINARADVAVAVGAPGVHLTSSPDELAPEQVRRLYAKAGLPAPVVTVSCHSIADVARLQDLAVDAILFGPVLEKSVAGVQCAEGTGLGLLREACRVAAPVPVLGVGGITHENTAACLAAGAAGVAGIRLFLRD